jgi:hypothetical protein
VCGEIVYDQVITLPPDLDPPILYPRRALNVACDKEPPKTPPKAVDCSGVNPATYEDGQSVPGPNCTFDNTLSSKVRTWTVTDSCGNSASINQTIHFKDKAPPLIQNCPADDTVSCHETIVMPAPPNATDACGPVTSDFDCCLDGNVITRNWTFTDLCGKESLCTQRVTITCPPKPPAAVP